MKIQFHNAKSERNKVKHGIALSAATRLDWEGMLVTPDTRHDYGEDRFKGLAPIGDRLYCVIFTPRDDAMRVISLRKANQKEYDEYEQSQG